MYFNITLSYLLHQIQYLSDDLVCDASSALLSAKQVTVDTLEKRYADLKVSSSVVEQLSSVVVANQLCDSGVTRIKVPLSNKGNKNEEKPAGTYETRKQTNQIRITRFGKLKPENAPDYERKVNV
uniref:Uncharacterized protein n=1 Tax=Romanomermis culicivorax TaxID=13658 RepID=A0A915I2K2_ROMCU